VSHDRQTPHGDMRPTSTIMDVARLAGVSHQTVSRVLNRLPNVRPATRARVERAIAQLRYVPSEAARALATKRSLSVGLIVEGPPGHGPTSTALHFTEAAARAGYAVLAAQIREPDSGQLREVVDLFVRRNVAAIGIVASSRGTVAAIAGGEVGVPVVAVGPDVADPSGSADPDQFRGAKAAVEHLIGLGHRHIRHVSGPPRSLDGSERTRAWRSALSEHGLEAPAPIVGDWTAAGGYAAARHLLATDPSLTAVFAANDQMALGLIRAFRESGMDIPADVSVVGFDDAPDAEYYTPPLTTVRRDLEAVAREAFDAVLAELGERRHGDIARRPTRLVERGSTAAPRSHSS